MESSNVGISDPAASSTIAAIRPEAAARFLAQAGFGGDSAAIAEVQSLGYANWINAQFKVTGSQSHWDWLVSKGYDQPAQKNNQAGLDATLWRQLLSSPDVLRQRIALALSEIFVVAPGNIPIAWKQFACAAYVDLLLANAFGNFRTLLEAVTLSPAMGVYLNLRGSQKADPASGRQPDENYAREVMQLFTIGLVQLNPDGTPKTDVWNQPIPTYDQSSIMGLAAALTGWEFTQQDNSRPDYTRRPMSMISSRHATGSQSFLGVTIPAGTSGAQALQIILDTLFRHPNVGPFIGKQLIQRLVTSNPSPAYVARVARVFNNNGVGVRGDMMAVIRAILLDDEARTVPTATSAGKLREPMLRFIQWARTFHASSPTDVWNIGDTSDPATKLGQSPLKSSSVFNFFRPGYVPPNSQIAAGGLVAPEFQIVNETTASGYLNFMQRAIARGIGEVTANYQSEDIIASVPSTLVSRYNLWLAAGQISAPNLAAIQAAVGSITGTTAAGLRNRVQATIMLVMASPEYLVQK